jgi:hypothetical protein
MTGYLNKMSFWQAKTKIRPTDTKFSRLIRARDNWHCVYKFKCIGSIDYQDNPGALTCSHYHKRRKESVRFDPLNCDSACRLCHAWVEDTMEGMIALNQWKLTQLGKREYDLLFIRANTYQARDDKLVALYLKNLKL